mmetsp:Transcript_8232/g.27352  ORF Transcript_8232/g.27352 Transcript_8232/m.27352 type:complete len:298 (+) Transcript_8232:864-1757(+)
MLRSRSTATRSCDAGAAESRRPRSMRGWRSSHGRNGSASATSRRSRTSLQASAGKSSRAFARRLPTGARRATRSRGGPGTPPKKRCCSGATTSRSACRCGRKPPRRSCTASPSTLRWRSPRGERRPSLGSAPRFTTLEPSSSTPPCSGGAPWSRGGTERGRDATAKSFCCSALAAWRRTVCVARSSRGSKPPSTSAIFAARSPRSSTAPSPTTRVIASSAGTTMSSRPSRSRRRWRRCCSESISSTTLSDGGRRPRLVMLCASRAAKPSSTFSARFANQSCSNGASSPRRSFAVSAC